jgi:phage gpG-like protein
MSKPVTITTNAPDVAESIRQKLAAMQKQLKNQMMRALTILEAEILQNVRSRSGLHVRTGALLNSISASKKVESTGAGNFTAQIGSVGVPYASTHEFGGLILPKNRQFLAIPTVANQRPDGSPIVTTGQLQIMQKLGMAFIHNGTIFQRLGGKESAPQPMFVLRRSVEVPARPFIRPALAAKQDQIMKDFGIFISASFDSKKG